MASPFTTSDRQLTQENRVAKLMTPLPKSSRGEDMLVFERLEASEGMSELFEFRVDALSTEADIDFKPALGLNCCVTIKTYNGDERHFNGVLTEAQWLGGKGPFYAYRLVLRPWFWTLGRESDCRIFKNKSIVDIAKLIFSESGYGDDLLKITCGEMGTGTIKYAVQYRESDLAFLSRWFEEHGIYYFFTHEADKHVLHLADAPGAHQAIQVGLASTSGGGAGGRTGEIRYVPLTGTDHRNRQHIYHWLAERRVRTGKFELRHFDWGKSATKPMAQKQTSESYNASNREVYDYPANFRGQEYGDALARIRLEAEQALDHRKYAAGDALSLFPGARFTLSDHHTDAGDYVVVRATHTYAQEAFRSGGGGNDPEFYHGHYELQNADRPFRAPIHTPKPIVHGPQTAFVVTKAAGSSEEIDVDEDGCIYVNFHWNRGKPNEDCSRPVRVAQMWAGKGWGWQVIPRVGMEVVVEFLEGDPDRPLVTGAVYNDKYQYPYKLPDKKNISGVKSDSTKGHNGFNELYFDDTKGSEKIRITAEKDRETIVQDSETREVWNWQKETIGKDFKGGQADSRTTTVVHGSDELLVKDGKWLQTVKNDWTNEVTDGNVSHTIKTGDFSQKVSMGNWSLKCDLGKIDMEAMQSITLKVGGNSIVVDQTGITIKGIMVKVEGTAMLETKAPMTQVNGSGMLMLKGGLVMIN